MNTNIETQIHQRFHIIDDRKIILLHNLKKLNHIQNEYQLTQYDLLENGLFYDSYKRTTIENEQVEKQIEIVSLANRCIDDIHGLTIETTNVIEIYDTITEVSEKENIQVLFSERFTPFIQGISNLESLFLCDLSTIKELLSQIKLFANILQKVLHFDIEMN